MTRFFPSLTVLAAAAVVSAAATSGAQAHDHRCTVAAGQKSMTIETAIGKAEALGYSVKEAKISKGCWEVEGFDRNGAEIEIVFDPVSGEVLKPHDWRAPSRP